MPLSTEMPAPVRATAVLEFFKSSASSAGVLVFISHTRIAIQRLQSGPGGTSPDSLILSPEERRRI